MEQQLKQCPVRYQALRQPQAIAIQSTHRSLSYSELDRQISYVTGQLFNRGLTTGDRLVCIAANSLNLILLQLSCMRSGIIFCPLNSRFSRDEVALRLDILSSNFIWCEQAKNQFHTLSLDFTAPQNYKPKLTTLRLDPRQVSNIIFTSGSSGQPKAVMHSFSNHFYSAQGSQQLIPLGKNDKNLLSLPIFHISGYATVFRTLLAGATLVLNNKLSIKTIKEQRITHLSLVATQLYRLLESPNFMQRHLAIKHLLLGGSAFSEQLLKQTEERGFCYHLSYGLTEMSSQVATSCNDRSLTILKDREVKIVNDEIWLRGKTRFVGYFTGELATSIIPQKQWFASKDLASKNGNQLRIIGRRDRQFICAGENIQPEEIEALLLNLPEIKQAYILALDDPEFVQRPVAFIDWHNGPANIEKVKTYLRNKLSPIKCPLHYFSLPQQSGLKVSLTELQKLLPAK